MQDKSSLSCKGRNARYPLLKISQLGLFSLILEGLCIDQHLSISSIVSTCYDLEQTQPDPLASLVVKSVFGRKLFYSTSEKMTVLLNRVRSRKVHLDHKSCIKWLTRTKLILMSVFVGRKLFFEFIYVCLGTNNFGCSNI